MALEVGVLYDAARRAFNSGTANARFAADFVDALNICLDELSFAADLSTAIAHVDSVETSISALNADDFAIVMAGLEIKLKDFGTINSKRGTEFMDRAQTRWEDKLGDFMVKKSREDQDDEDDDGDAESDIIGLGYIGQ